ncbi:MAG: hypothetical protein HDR22_10465 [Lachnospiraceae bacterium]|nr:hypothetical protein [Lachnospiraceae bacterium]
MFKLKTNGNVPHKGVYMNIYLKLFAYFVVYSAMMSYYEEYTNTRHSMTKRSYKR